jgi:hypothetical protein
MYLLISVSNEEFLLQNGVFLPLNEALLDKNEEKAGF